MWCLLRNHTATEVEQGLISNLKVQPEPFCWQWKLFSISSTQCDGVAQLDSSLYWNRSITYRLQRSITIINSQKTQCSDFNFNQSVMIYCWIRNIKIKEWIDWCSWTWYLTHRDLVMQVFGSEIIHWTAALESVPHREGGCNDSMTLLMQTASLKW